MKPLMSVLAVSLCCSFLLSCRNGHEDVVQEQEKAKKEISAAQGEVAEQRAESKESIDQARAKGDLEELEDAKLEATTKLADAEKNVNQKKIDGTEAITDAKRDAGETTGTLTHE